MARNTRGTKSTKKSKRERELEKEVDSLRSTLNMAALGASRMNSPQQSVGDLYVGIRNICDLTVGLKSPFPNEPDVQLYADLGPPNPGNVAIISYAWWLQLRKQRPVADGLIVRDDRILGDSWRPAPPDRPEDLPTGCEKNQILDPVAWIDSRNEQEIRQGIAALTSTAALYRLRRAVDDKIRSFQSAYELADPNRAVKAYEQVSAIYQLVDSLTSQRLVDALPA